MWSIFKNLKKKFMNTIIINGEKFEVFGNNVRIINDQVIVNGKVIKDGLSGITKVEWIGDVANLACNIAEVKGNVSNGADCNTLTCNNIQGNVDANSINCHDIFGNIDANSVKYSGKYNDKPSMLFGK